MLISTGNGEKITLDTYNDSPTQKVVFKGSLPPQALDELRELYLVRSKLYPVAYLLLTVVTGGLSVANFFSDSDIGSGIFFGFCSLVLFYLAVLAPKISCHSWLAQITEIPLTGQLDTFGVTLKLQSNVILWEDFIHARVGNNAILLYFSKINAVPVHKVLFGTEDEWVAAKSLIHRSISSIHVVN